ncbi:MAG TPA: TRAP transporter permease DctQ [Rhizobiales bacterium]|nr:TRAP transporter permease DctQ [Hyphomicrobiales bacterium]
MLSIAFAVTALNRTLFRLVKWLVVLFALLMLYEVAARYSFDSPTSWAPELATLLFGPFFLLGGPYLLHTGGHVSVDLLSARASGLGAKALKVIAIILAIVFGVILLWFAFPLAEQSFQYRETSYTSWNPPVWPAKLVLPVSALLLVLQGFAELLFVLHEEVTSQ